ncbi:hypothetical protein N7520_005425 [Penicillium odoratum]|uniref:uncharacterized protein n=1 Tax=Penicillium odoratum TaxID=1167516 RepID=UPI002549B3D8|nr:uncharacterized protein N7520_005425 [Penicillium odoratum]KAJ5765866.1 hypothetical protein N7520_005425 [Penicillium odoratum]
MEWGYSPSRLVFPMNVYLNGLLEYYYVCVLMPNATTTGGNLALSADNSTTSASLTASCTITVTTGVSLSIPTSYQKCGLIQNSPTWSPAAKASTSSKATTTAKTLLSKPTSPSQTSTPRNQLSEETARTLNLGNMSVWEILDH